MRITDKVYTTNYDLFTEINISKNSGLEKKISKHPLYFLLKKKEY